MIDADKYEGHSTGWKRKTNHSTYSIINDDGHKVASIGCWVDVWKDKSNIDSQLIADAPLLLEEVKRLREESKKKGDVLTTLDEMIRNYASHVEMMKALEQGLGLLETWKEMIE